MGRAKSKAKSPGGSVPNRHLHSRVSYLYQAARYLDSNSIGHKDSTKTLDRGHSRYLVDQLQGVSLKSQIRLAPNVKQTICKRCQGILQEGDLLRSYVENKSRDEHKPWADVLVRECKACDAKRRYPIGVRRQKRRQQRSANLEKHEQEEAPTTNQAV